MKLLDESNKVAPLRLEGKVTVPAHSRVEISLRIDRDGPQLKVVGDSDHPQKSEFLLRTGSKFRDNTMTLPFELDSIIEEYVQALPSVLEWYGGIFKPR